MADPVIVPVKSAWLSRVNQIAIGVFGLALPIGALAPILPPPYQAYALAAVSVLGAFGIWYYRTFQTASVTPTTAASAASATPTITQIMRNANVSADSQADVLNEIELNALKPK